MKNRSRFPLEKNIVNEILAALRGHGVKFVRKIHGDPYQTNGIPDILTTEPSTGRFVGLEVKRPDTGKATSLQRKALDEINASNGYATIVMNVEQAIGAMQNAARGCKVEVAILDFERGGLRAQGESESSEGYGYEGLFHWFSLIILEA